MIKSTIEKGEVEDFNFPCLYKSTITGNVLLVTKWAGEKDVKAFVQAVVLSAAEDSYRPVGWVYDMLDFPQDSLLPFDGKLTLENLHE